MIGIMEIKIYLESKEDVLNSVPSTAYVAVFDNGERLLGSVIAEGEYFHELDSGMGFHAEPAGDAIENVYEIARQVRKHLESLGEFENQIRQQVGL